MKLDHVALSVHDVEAAILHFSTLGFVVRRRGKHYANGMPTAFINHPETNMDLELVQVAGQPAPGFLHIAFVVPDLQAKCAELLKAGYGYETKPFLNEAAKTHMAFLRHPSGLIAQVNQPA